MSARDKAVEVARIADDQKAEAIVALDVKGQCNFTDFFVVATCDSSVQLRAVSRRIQHELREIGCRPIADNDTASHSWVIVDYGDVVVHLFSTESREYYRLESLWADARRVDWAK